MDKREDLFRHFSWIALAIVALGASLVLVGWVLAIPLFKSVLPDLVAMNPATAALFLLTAFSLSIVTIRPRTTALEVLRATVAGVVISVAFAVLLGFLLDWESGIDRIVFADVLGENRMAPNTAAYFMLIGSAIAIAGIRGIGRYASQALALIVLGGAFVSLLGYGYSTKGLYGIGNLIPMALHTAILFEVAAFGLLCNFGRQGLLSFFCGTAPGNMLVRRLLPTAVIVPCVLGFLRIQGELAGWYSSGLGVAIMVAMTAVFLAAAILFTAHALNRNEIDRLQSAYELEEAHLKLHSQTQILQSILDSMEDGVVVANESGRLIQFNPTAQQILGTDARDISQGQWSNHFGIYLADGKTLCSPEQLPLARSLRGESVAEEELFISNEFRSESVWISISARPLYDAEGELQGGVVVFRDISERKALDEAMCNHREELESQVLERTNDLTEANKELVQKNQEVEMFIYSVSHDLRSPLVNLQGFSKELDLVANELKTMLATEAIPADIRLKSKTLLEEDVSQALHFIQTAVNRLGNIIDALLQLSRVGRVEYQWKAIDVHGLVVRVVDSMSSTLYDAGIDVCVQELPDCYGDETALEQLFANLIGNALKYRDTSRPSSIEIGAVPQQSTASAISTRTYYVKDNGLGIPEAHQEKIFQAFKRVHPHAATGEGMGLAIVRRTVERHGGSVWMESEVGLGSIFFVALSGRALERRALPRTSDTLQGDYGHATGTNGNPTGGRR